MVTDVQFGHLFLVYIKYDALQEVTYLWVIQKNMTLYIVQCLSQELKKVRHMSHQAEKGETQYHKAETHVSPS